MWVPLLTFACQTGALFSECCNALCLARLFQTCQFGMLLKPILGDFIEQFFCASNGPQTARQEAERKLPEENWEFVKRIRWEGRNPGRQPAHSAEGAPEEGLLQRTPCVQPGFGEQVVPLARGRGLGAEHGALTDDLPPLALSSGVAAQARRDGKVTVPARVTTVAATTPRICARDYWRCMEKPRRSHSVFW